MTLPRNGLGGRVRDLCGIFNRNQGLLPLLCSLTPPSAKVGVRSADRCISFDSASRSSRWRQVGLGQASAVSLSSRTTRFSTVGRSWTSAVEWPLLQIVFQGLTAGGRLGRCGPRGRGRSSGSSPAATSDCLRKLASGVDQHPFVIWVGAGFLRCDEARAHDHHIGAQRKRRGDPATAGDAAGEHYQSVGPLSG